jgi:hypothetical protein
MFILSWFSLDRSRGDMDGSVLGEEPSLFTVYSRLKMTDRYGFSLVNCRNGFGHEFPWLKHEDQFTFPLNPRLSGKDCALCGRKIT